MSLKLPFFDSLRTKPSSQCSFQKICPETYTTTFMTTFTSKLHIFDLYDYNWESKKMFVPEIKPQNIKFHSVPGLYWQKMETNMLSKDKLEILELNDVKSIQNYIMNEIENDTSIIFNVGFADFLHDKLIHITGEKNINLVTSSLNVIPHLDGNTLIITYSRKLLHNYLYQTRVGIQKYSSYYNKLNIIGFEDINKDFQEMMSQDFVLPEQNHKEFFDDLVLKTTKCISENDTKISNIVVECTAIMEIVPVLKEFYQGKINVIGVYDVLFQNQNSSN